MDRKVVLICIVSVVILVFANAVAVFFLYRPTAASLPMQETPVSELESSEPAVSGMETSVEASAPETAEKDSAVVETVKQTVLVSVPEGPFQVKNSSTGKVNTLIQNDDFSLTLKDEKGASQWVMPFSGDLCGRVCNVDFYANGKLQFLFCSGNKLCLVDRLGRMVSGFPVILSKDVLLGPDVYDFSGARRYNIIVLNRDNSIDMYNLKGEKPQKWTSIAPAEKVAAMPEYIEVGAKSYWGVKTADGCTSVYSFYGEHVKTFTSEINKNELY